MPVSKRSVVLLFVAFFTLVFDQQLMAQTKKAVNGVIKDSTDTGIPSAHVRLISGKDTLNTSADYEGRFSFTGISLHTFELLVRGIGYKAYTGTYTFKDKQTELHLDPVILKAETQMLNEVVIQGQIRPVRVMKDTIEYNAGAYVVRENDHIEDLLKQLPGVEVDQEGKVTTMGKELTKIRVDGKDFFTGNVKEFIKQLPADMVSHLQVIDDYGDKANFTGIKTGEPSKMLNLVTKPGRNRGKFGDVGVNAGTNKRYGLNGGLNLWNAEQQIGLSSSLSNANNSAGMSRNVNSGINIRRPVNKNLIVSSGYGYGQNRDEYKTESFVETLNELGTIYNDSRNRSSRTGNANNLNFDLNERLKDDYLNVSVNGSLSDNRSNNQSSSIQTGVIRQDLVTESGNKSQNPALSVNVGWGKKFGKKRKRMIMMNFKTGFDANDNEEDILTHTGYYDRTTDQLSKDSVLNRLVESKNRNNNLNADFSFSEPLTKPTDTVKRKSIDFSYAVAISSTNNSLHTNVMNGQGQVNFVDSLSNTYRTFFINHNFNVSYRYGAKKLDYSLGMSVQPSALTGSYEGRSDKIHQTAVNMIPTATARIMINQGQSVNFGYNGSSNAPAFEQLQPVPDTRNLQNIIIGNPDLKTTFVHAFNLGYRIFGSTTGRALQIGLNGNVTQNQVVSNVVLIPDTLNGFKQETRYVNANGNYHLGSNYSVSWPLAKRKYNISINGNLGFNHVVLYTDNVKNFNKALSISQSLKAAMNAQKITLETDVTYSYSGNAYSLAASRPRNIESWLLNMQSKFRASSFIYFNANVSKRINNGYALNATNPLLIGTGVETFFLKNRMASLTIEANDLLNQGNMLSRIITNNSIIDNKSTQVTRYVVMNFSMRLQNFGGKKKS